MGAASETARPDKAIGNRARTAIGWASGGGTPEPEPAPPQPEGEREGYETGDRLGASPGEVYEATHARLPGRFAIKFLTRARGATAAAMEAFQAEAEQISVLRHPNIVEVIELGVMPDGTPILVMEHLEGRTLEELLANRGPIALPEVVPIIKCIASALEAAHKVGVVHRAVRPDNILIANVTGYEQGFPKLLDFGVSRLDVGPSPGSNLATTAARYLAPEQARGQTSEVDGRTDQYALAALAYRMLSGVDAFGGNDVISVLYRVLNDAPRSLTALAPVDTTIDSILRKAMSRDKRLRFDSVFVFAKSLEDAAGMGSRMVRNPLLGAPAASQVRFVPSTAPAPAAAPERPVSAPVPAPVSAPAPARAERSERQARSSDRLPELRSQDRQHRDDRERTVSSDRLSEQRPDRQDTQDRQDRQDREERAFSSGRSSDRLEAQRPQERGENMWSSERLPQQRSSRSSDRNERTSSFRDTLSERFFAEGERKAEEGAWTAADLDDHRPEGADQFDDFDDVPRRRWPMLVGIAVVAAIVPVVVMYAPDLRLLFSSRPSSFWSEPRAGTVHPTTVEYGPQAPPAAAPAAAEAAVVPIPVPVAPKIVNIPPATREAPARAEAPPAQPAPAAAAPAPAQVAAPPPAAAWPAAPAQPAPAQAAPTQPWPPPAAAAPSAGWAQPATPPPAPAGGWQNAPAQPAAAVPSQPTNSAAWAPVNPAPATAPPAVREPRTGGEPANVPLRGYVWSPKERRLVPAQ